MQGFLKMWGRATGLLGLTYTTKILQLQFLPRDAMLAWYYKSRIIQGALLVMKRSFTRTTATKLTSVVELKLQSVDEVCERDETIQRVIDQHNPDTRPCYLYTTETALSQSPPF